MSYNVKDDTITVEGITYDVNREDEGAFGERLTITLDGADVFPGLSGKIAGEEYIESRMNPRDDNDGILGAMLTATRNYDLGGGQDDESVNYAPDFTVGCERCEGSGYVAAGPDDDARDIDSDGEVPCPACDCEGQVEVDPVTWAKTVHGARVVLPLYLYDHGGISICAGTFGQSPGYPYDCQWDAGTVGIVFDTEVTRKRCGCEDWDDERIEASIREEIKWYDLYLQNSVYYWSVEDDALGTVEGYSGTVDEWNAPTTNIECFAALEDAIEARLREDRERAYWQDREVITL